MVYAREILGIEGFRAFESVRERPLFQLEREFGVFGGSGSGSGSSRSAGDCAKGSDARNECEAWLMLVLKEERLVVRPRREDFRGGNSEGVERFIIDEFWWRGALY